MSSFRVRAIGGGTAPAGPLEDVGAYLQSVHRRFRNAEHAQTRVFTARTGEAPFELEWNGAGVPGETLLGAFGWSVSPELIAAVTAAIARGEPVRLFIFNSDAELCFQEVLVPAVVRGHVSEG